MKKIIAGFLAIIIGILSMLMLLFIAIAGKIDEDNVNRRTKIIAFLSVLIIRFAYKKLRKNKKSILEDSIDS